MPETLADQSAKPRFVRVVFNAEQESDLHWILMNKRETSKDLSMPGMLLDWLYETGVSTDKIKEWKVLSYDGKITFTRRNPAGTTVNYTVKLEDLPELPHGSDDGSEGYVLPLGSEIYPRFLNVARMEVAKLQVAEMTMDFKDLQGWAKRLLIAKLREEVGALAEKELKQEKEAAQKRMGQPEEKAAEKPS